MRFFTPIIVVLFLASLIVNMVMYAKYRSRRPILTVNGQSITKKDMYDYLEQNFSPQYKAMQVQRMLISQAAQAKNLAAKDSEVEENYNEQKELNWQFAQRVNSNPWIADESKNEVKMGIESNRLMVDRIDAKAPITPEEIMEEYTRNNTQYDTPNKARVELAVILNEKHSSEIKQLMEKGTSEKKDLVSPQVIKQNYPTEVFFLGDNNHFTVTQRFGTTENAAIFTMKPNEVKIFPPSVVPANFGAKAVIIRMEKIEPGHKNDPNKDPKTLERVKTVLASRRGNFQTVLQELWDKASIVSEEPGDKNNIERVLFPDRYR
jgi:hypothetical protein